MTIKGFSAISVSVLFLIGGWTFSAAAQPAYSVLFVGTTSGGDALLIEHLQGLGLAVNVKDAKETQPADADLYSLIYVSESVASDKVADKFKATGSPVMFAEHYVADDMEFAGAAKNIDYGQTPEQYRQLTIKKPDHPLAAGFSGAVTIYNADGKFGFSLPAGEVDIIAVAPDDESKAVLYAYEQGAKNKNGGIVPGRRVFFYLFAGQEAKQTEDGWKLFDAAVQWCLASAKPMTAEMKAAVAAQQPAEPAIPVPTKPAQGTPPDPFTGVPAFPGAEGFGMGSQGGRGGKLYKVTNLNDSGEGSLRAAVEASGPRIVIFEVGGTLQLQSALKIRNDFITIAGQTAPGDGITLRDYPITIDANHVILRYLRVRLGDEAKQEADAIWVAGGSQIIIDHCSVGWAVDETLSVSQGRDPSKKFLDNVTVQWCVISESLNQSVHAKGAHGYGSLVRGYDGAKITYHHNLWAHHASRMPRPGNYESYKTDPYGALLDFRNNVFYNWGGNHSGYNADTESITRYNFINNYYLQGPNSVGAKAFDESCQFARAYFSGNYMNEAEPADPWSLVTGVTGGAYKLANPLPAGTISTDSAPDAYRRVLAGAGASNVRDAVDQRVLADVVQRTGKIINSAQEVGGWPVVNSGTAPLDSDGDGMSDAWETAQGLNPNNNRDGNLDQDADGYTNLEEYVNSLVSE